MKTAITILVMYASIVTLALMIKTPQPEIETINHTCKSGIFEFVEAYDKYGDDLSFFKCVEEEDYVESSTSNNSSHNDINNGDK